MRAYVVKLGTAEQLGIQKEPLPDFMNDPNDPRPMCPCTLCAIRRAWEAAEGKMKESGDLNAAMGYAKEAERFRKASDDLLAYRDVIGQLELLLDNKAIEGTEEIIRKYAPDEPVDLATLATLRDAILQIRADRKRLMEENPHWRALREWAERDPRRKEFVARELDGE